MRATIDHRGTTRSDEGASAVEFALLLPLFILLLFGIIQFGLALNDYITVAHAAREGARLAAVGDYDPGVVAARAAPLPVTVSLDAATTEFVQVTVRCPFNLRIPLFRSQVLNISSTAVMRTETN